MEELTRALTCGDESQVDSAKERAALLQQLHGAEQVGSTRSSCICSIHPHGPQACHTTDGLLMRQPQSEMLILSRDVAGAL